MQPTPPTRFARAREGFALAGALLALVIVGALVTGTFYAATEEGAMGTASARSDDALYLAEQGVNDAIGTTDSRTIDLMNPGDSTAVTVGTVSGFGTYRYRFVKVGKLSMLISTGFPTRGVAADQGARTLAMFVRTEQMKVPMDRAITSSDSWDLRGNTTISGRDTVPTLWSGDNCTSSGAQKGIVVGSGASVTVGGSADVNGGSYTDATIADSTFTKLGDFVWSQLVSQATSGHTFSGSPTLSSIAPSPGSGATSGSCNTSTSTNWGAPEEPNHPCHSFFPVIYYTGGGTLHITSNGSGQGVLLVDGNLDMSGSFNFYGVIIVRGNLDMSGSGQIIGSLMVQDSAHVSGPSDVTGTTKIQLSTCAIDKAVHALTATAHPLPIRQRSWADFTGTGQILLLGGSLTSP